MSADTDRLRAFVKSPYPTTCQSCQKGVLTVLTVAPLPLFQKLRDLRPGVQRSGLAKRKGRRPPPLLPLRLLSSFSRGVRLPASRICTEPRPIVLRR
jgi:hypothetical protein